MAEGEATGEAAKTPGRHIGPGIPTQTERFEIGDPKGLARKLAAEKAAEQFGGKVKGLTDEDYRRLLESDKTGTGEASAVPLDDKSHEWRKKAYVERPLMAEKQAKEFGGTEGAQGAGVTDQDLERILENDQTSAPEVPPASPKTSK